MNVSLLSTPIGRSAQYARSRSAAISHKPSVNRQSWGFRLRPARLGIAAVGGRRNRAHLPAASLGGRPQRGREESADPANEGGRQHAPRVGVVRIASDERDEAAPL